MTDTAAHLEIEVKFHLPDPQIVANRLLAHGAIDHPAVFETNLCFDDRQDSLMRSGNLLRLRSDGRIRLTFKSQAVRETTDFKVFNELEVEVGDFNTMAAILHALGYRTARIYEKWRRTFEWRGVSLCLDTLPFGHFLEIEGDGPAIRQAADALELPWGERIVINYLAIFEWIRKGLHLPFTDVTFDHFRPHPVNIDPFLPLIRAAKR